MIQLIKKGIIILGVYSVFTAYLFFACDRIERLDEVDDSTEIVNVSINYGD